MHLLLIEDNQHIWSNIKQFLELEGCVVDRIVDGREGLEQALKATYDCVILDMMLPELDWISLLNELRTQKKTPVIMATAKGQLDDKAQSYEAWADDYIVKPFALEELWMRIQAIVKRGHPQDIFRRREIEVHMEENLVLKDGEPIALPLKEFQILACLIDQDGRVISRTDLVDQIRWSESLFENDSKLDVYISNLRKKLGKELIVTVKWFGYKLGQA
jgi:two-component system, OmpR family, response regulator